MISFATKILLQMSTKLGGVPWRVPIPTKRLCVMGYDANHDTANRTYSFGALVASTNDDLTRYTSAVSRHARGEEMSSHMGEMFRKVLNKYREKNGGRLPASIVFYRDGVGDGQLLFVKELEVEAMLKVLREAASDKEDMPKLVVIVVSKRINTRFFSDGGRNFDNPHSGTVVDDVVSIGKFPLFVAFLQAVCCCFMQKHMFSSYVVLLLHCYFLFIYVETTKYFQYT